MPVRGTTTAVAVGERRRLADLRRLGDRHREVALRDRDLETRTSLPMTMMPECSSMTTRAGLVGLDAQLLDLGQELDDVALDTWAGSVMPIVAGSVGSATRQPMNSLIAAAMRLAVVKSGLRRASRSIF